MDRISDSSSVLHIKIDIKKQEDAEVVKKERKRFQVVEIADFTFKRYKKEQCSDKQVPATETICQEKELETADVCPVPESVVVEDKNSFPVRLTIRDELQIRLSELQETERILLNTYKKCSEVLDECLPTAKASTALSPVKATSCHLKLANDSTICARKLALEEEYLVGCIGKLEALAEIAEELCPVLQAKYHKEKFGVFPHVNSPLWLIKRMSMVEKTIKTQQLLATYV